MAAELQGPPDASARAAQRLAWLVFGVGVTAALHIGKLPVAIPVLQDALGLSLVQAGFLLSLVQLAGMTLGLFVGLLADRVGPRRVMQAGLLLLAAGSALGALAPGVGWLLASRVVEGLGFLLAVLPAPGLLRQRVLHAPTLSRALGWWGAYMPLGTALALLLGAALDRWGRLARHLAGPERTGLAGLRGVQLARAAACRDGRAGRRGRAAARACSARCARAVPGWSPWRSCCTPGNGWR